jgi:hypothetical protein
VDNHKLIMMGVTGARALAGNSTHPLQRRICPTFGRPTFEQGYSAGKTTSVKSVLEMSPPMTTVASGFWTSAPVPVAMAIGTKPREATSAVINTGRKRVRSLESVLER